MTTTIVFQIQSALILSLMLFGIAKRRNRALHVKTMLTAIIWDLLLILQIELSRSAIATAVKPLSNKLILNIHISLAVTTVIFYVLMIISGRKILKGDNSKRFRHKTFGICTLILRILTFITSFYAS